VNIVEEQILQKKPLLSTIRFLVRNLTKFNVIHQDYIPKTGPLLMTSNHLSRLDTPLLMSITDRNDLVAIVAKSYQKKPFFKWILERLGTMVWMDRENPELSSIREAMDYLRSGVIVGIAPEGTRSRNFQGLLEGKQGAALLAARGSIPILPVGIAGSEKINDYFKRLKRPPVTMRIGKPYTIPAMDRDDRQAWLKRYTDEIMCRIAAQLPQAYRGFYADHPRLMELLEEEQQA
jgi:1-acyl-sn-glycerol-3-phosphate acyltransferase